MKTTFALIALTLSTTAQAAVLASSDYSAQLDQVTRAIIGAKAAETTVAHYYAGVDQAGRQCLVSVLATPSDLTVEIQGIGANGHKGQLDASIYREASFVTDVEATTGEQFVSFNVKQKNYRHLMSAELNTEMAGLGVLQEVRVIEAGPRGTESLQCNDLEAIASLHPDTLESAIAEAAAQYFAKEGIKVPQYTAEDLSASACRLDSPTRITCDVSIPTDYTPDTLHITFEVNDLDVGAVASYDYEAGC